MMITGQIEKAKGGLWRAECPLVGAITQGKSRADASAMLADCIETLIGEGTPSIIVTEIGSANGKTDAFLVSVDADDVTLLLALVLKHQRRVHKLTAADVAKKLGSSSLNAYSAYEQGKREPSVAKYRQLLAAIAPEIRLKLVVVPQVGVMMTGNDRVSRDKPRPSTPTQSKARGL